MKTFEIGDLVVLTRIQIGYRPTGIVIGIREWPNGQIFYDVDWSLSLSRRWVLPHGDYESYSLTKLKVLLERGETVEAQIILD